MCEKRANPTAFYALRLNGPLGKNKHSNKEQAGYDHLALTYLTVARFTDLYWCQLLFGVTKVLKFLKLQQQKTFLPEQVFTSILFAKMPIRLCS